MGGKRCKNWKGYEDQILEDYLLAKGIEGCHKKLPHRTKSAISHRAQRLGMKRKPGPKVKDLTGRFFGGWEVLRRGEDYVSPKGYHSPQWLCRCKCGTEKLVTANSLKNRKSKSCGNCNPLEIGKVYNKWIEPLERVEDYINPSGYHKQQFRVKCHYGAEGCKGVFVTREDNIKNGIIRSCGCLRDEKSRERCGELSPSWQGGITELHFQIRNYIKNTNWKDFCRKRDNYTCQKCDKRGGGNLPVHHCKISFHSILEKVVTDGITDVRDIPDDSEFWNTDNGITLCEDCHKEFHNIYGGNFTAEDFKIWFLAITPEFAGELSLNVS